MRRVIQLLAVLLASWTLGGCWWWVPGYNADRTAHNPVERSLSPANVAELAEAWTYGPWGVRIPAPVVSQGGVHVAVGGCGIASLDRATGDERWTRSWFESISGCSDPFSPIVYASAPFVTDDRVLGGVFWWVQSTPSPRFDYFSQGYGIDDGQDTGRVQRQVIAAVRSDQALFVAPLITTLNNPIPIPTGFGPMVFATFGPLADPSQQRTIRTAVTSGGQPLESAIPTLGSEKLFHAGTGVLSTTPGDPTTGRSVRAYSLFESHPGCGPAETLVECPVWSQPVDGTVTASPVLNTIQNRLYVATNAGTVYNFDANNGVLQWKASVGAPVVAESALAEGVLYVPTADGRLHAFDALGCGAVDCPALWTADTGSAVEVQPAVAGGLVFTGCVDGTLHAYAAGGCGSMTCPALWTASTGSEITGAPAVVGGTVYVGTADGRVIAYRRT